MYDIISIGDSTIDTIVEVNNAAVTCRVDNDCYLKLKFPSKIPVDTIAQKVAGNSINNAIGMARLGFKTGFHTILGGDMSGKTIMKELKEENVDTRYVEILKKGQSNASTVINYHGDRTILVYHAPRKYRLPKLAKTNWMYYSSIGEDHKKYNKQIINYIKKCGAKMGYNPGTYQFLEGVGEIKKVCAVTHVLFLNVQEAHKLVGNKKDTKSLLRALYRLGPKIAVITDGENGSFVFDGVNYWKMGIYKKVKAIERTGAGDSYAVGFMSALMDDKDIPEAMLRGNLNSSSVISKIGPQDGLLTRSGLQRMLRKYGRLKAENI